MKTTILRKNSDTGRIYLRESMLVAFFLRPPVHEAVEGLRSVLDLFLAKIPADAITWSSVGASSEEWRPFAKTTIARVRDQLKPAAAAKRKLTSFALTDGAVGGDAPGYGIDVVGAPVDPQRPDELVLLQLTFPMETVEAKSADEFVSFCTQISSLVSYVSGYAAPCLLWSEIDSGLGAFEAKPIAIRHPGYDVQNNEATCMRLGKRVRGAFWLNFLGPELVDALGGPEKLRAQLPKAISVEPAGQGVTIRAGALPELGDVNKGVGVPLLREVAKVLEPVTAFADRALLGQFTNFDQDYFDRWDRRLFA